MLTNESYNEKHQIQALSLTPVTPPPHPPIYEAIMKNIKNYEIVSHLNFSFDDEQTTMHQCFDSVSTFPRKVTNCYTACCPPFANRMSRRRLEFFECLVSLLFKVPKIFECYDFWVPRILSAMIFECQKLRVAGISSAMSLECHIIWDAINAGSPEAWISRINS